MPVVYHLPHQVETADALLAHLVDAHGYARSTIEGGMRSFLLSIHQRTHERMAQDPDGTVAEMAGSAERLSRSALEMLERLLPQDRDLARRLASRWADALTNLVR